MGESAAASILQPVVDEVVKCISAVVKRQFNYLCCFTTNVNGLEDEAKTLDDATQGVQGEVDRETENAQDIVPAVETWLADSNYFKAKVNGLLLNEIPKVKSGCFKLTARYSLSKKAMKTAEAMKEHRQKWTEIASNGISHPKPPTAMVQIPSADEFESRKYIEEKIMTCLKGDDRDMIGICGMGGLGKTTMANKIRNRALEEHVFDEVVMAVVSQQVDKSKIQQQIAEQLGVNLVEQTLLARANRLRERLNDSKRTLLILDDVWERLKLVEMGIPYGSSQGCRVLFTSRNRDCLSGMDVGKVFGMEILSEEEAWLLFRGKAGTCVADTRLNPIAKEVVRECRGLPIALVTVGAAMKDEMDEGIWKDAVKQLRKANPKYMPEFIKEVYNPLEVSYTKLVSEEAKSLFLLCCLFPEDANISVGELTNFCMGLHILEDVTSLEDARDRMCGLIKLLKSRSLLLDGRYTDCVRIHDVVRDVCTFIAKQKGYIGGNECNWISSFERSEFPVGLGFPNLRLLVLTEDHFSDEDEQMKININNFFEGIRDLYVLSMEEYPWRSLPPTPTQSLKNLGTLILKSCQKLETISVVGDLVNLEILICSNCDLIKELPVEIGRLNRLKLLELSECEQLQSIGRGVISSLIGLEELKMLGSFNQWGSEEGRERQKNALLRELEALTNLICLEIEIKDPALASEMMHLSSRMKRFEIRIPAGFDIFLKRFEIRIPAGFDIFPWRYNKKMCLHWEGETCLGDWIEMQILCDTECLYLTGNGANKLALQKNQNLQRLELGECETIRNIVTTSMDDEGRNNADTMFLSIEYLKLFSLPNLEEIWDGPISLNSFQYLKQIILEDLPALEQLWKSSSLHRNNYVSPFTNLFSIEVKRCPRLRNLCHFAIEERGCLTQLEILNIEECEMMEHVFFHNEEENQRNVDKTLVFSKLKFMSLKSLPRLTNLCKGIENFEFPLLEHIQLKDCPLLQTAHTINLFNKPDKLKMELWKSQPFKTAEYLTLEGDAKRNLDFRVAQNIRCLSFRECETGTKLVHVTTMDALFPRLVVLRLVTLFKLQEIWDIDDGPIPSDSFKNLKELRLEFLPALNHLWKSSNISPSQVNVVSIFSQLSSIYIYGCHSLRNLFTLPVTTSGSRLLQLERLVIESCDMMEHVFLWNEESESHNRIHIPNLKVLILDSLPRLTSFCKGTESVELPLLDRKRISRCPLLETQFSTYGSSYDQDDVDNDSAHLFCKPHQEKMEMQEKMELKVQGIITWGNMIQECVEYMPLEGDGSPISHVEVAQSMRCLVFRECWMNMTTIATVFPLLEVMWLVKIADIEEICDIDAMKNLKELRLKSLPALKHLLQSRSSSSQMNVVSIFSKLSCIYIYGCRRLRYLFSLSVMATGSSCLFHLERLVIESCDTMEQVFLWNDEEEERKIDITLIFPKLKFLSLISLPLLTSFCKGKGSFEFPLLVQMKISRCPLQKILVSTGGWCPENLDDGDNQSDKVPEYDIFQRQLAIAGKSCISHLEILNVEECEMMEHVFFHNEEENQRNVDKTLVFSKLKFMSLKSLPRLTNLCKGIENFEFPLLEHIQLKDCPLLQTAHTINLFNKPDKLKMELWKSLPFKTAEYLTLEGDAKINLDFRVAQNIRCLSFRECETGTKLVHVTTMDALFPRLVVLRLVTLFKLQEIWDIDDGPIPSDSFKNLKELRLEFLPALNHLWKSSNISPSQVNVVSIFSQLSSIHIYGCHSLRNLFTLPVTTSGSCTLQLERLVIESCDMMEQVFLWNEESESHNRIHIPNLKVLILDSLPRLTSFCKGTESVEFPPLDRMRISRCPLLENFVSLYDYDDHGDDDSVHLFCKPYNKEKMELKLQGNITLGNRIEECVEYMSPEGDGSRILDIEVAQTMRCLTFRECWINMMTTIATVFPLLEVMWLVDITDIEEIRDIYAVKNLKELRLKSLPALKHLRQISSTPSHMNAVSIFNQLSCIYIYGCRRLRYLFSLSVMATGSSCLFHLERLVIESCDTMEQVFLWNDEEEEEVVLWNDDAVEEVEEERNIDITLIFPKLKFMSLKSLPRLTNLCKGIENFEAPLLEHIQLKDCPLLITAHTINLLNKPDKLSSIYIYGCRRLCYLFSLSVMATGSSCLLHLERLVIEQCDMMEQVFLWEGEERNTYIKLVFPKLMFLSLISLPKLTSFCKGKESFEFPLISRMRITRCPLLVLGNFVSNDVSPDDHDDGLDDSIPDKGSSSGPYQMKVGRIFNQLSSIHIYGCNGLCNLFPLSMIEGGSCLLQLERLEIESCEMMEQVFLWNAESEEQTSIHVGKFPKLNLLRLSFLPRLADFCRGVKRIECPLLEVKIVNCPKLRSSVSWNGKHSLIFNRSKSVQHQRAEHTNTAMQMRRPGTENKGKRRLEDSTNEDSSYGLQKRGRSSTEIEEW